jgi:hypothetical protein
MTKEFVPYELALKLKQLGFDEPCLKSYGDDGLLNQNDYSLYLSAPLFQQAFRWFREKYDLEAIPQRAEERMWYKFWIYKLYEDCKIMISSKILFNTYKEAELACLDKLIELVESELK